jgi:hypothetical protein
LIPVQIFSSSQIPGARETAVAAPYCKLRQKKHPASFVLLDYAYRSRATAQSRELRGSALAREKILDKDPFLG